jgi:hypothetical protein
VIEQIYREQRVYERLGDIFDPSKFEHSRDASWLGDAIVIELLDKFAMSVRQQVGTRLPDACDAGLKEIDNVRPLSMIPIWVDGLLTNTCTAELAKEIKTIWNDLVHEFLYLDFVRNCPFGSSILIKLVLKFPVRCPWLVLAT